MNYKDIEVYKENKDIFFKDTTRKTLFHKFIKENIRFLRRFLPRKQVQIIISERIVEYPILFQYLDLEGGDILDFGCVESLLPVTLCALGFKVKGLDLRPYPFKHENFEFIQEDILNWQVPLETFDAVISISTIEHVGLSAYGDPKKEKGDKVATDKLLSALKPGGRLYLTVPVGKSLINDRFRVYSPEDIRELVPNIKVLRFFSKPTLYSSGWSEIKEEDVASIEYEDYNVPAPVQAVAFIIARKK